MQMNNLTPLGTVIVILALCIVGLAAVAIVSAGFYFFPDLFLLGTLWVLTAATLVICWIGMLSAYLSGRH
jgi:hypothetical protein